LIAYTLEIWQTVRLIHVQDRIEMIDGAPDIEVRLMRRQLHALTPRLDGTMLTLQFKDGRRLDGWVKGARFIPTGSFARRETDTPR
jgi:hypothetical protein